MNLGIESEYQEFKESLGQLNKGLKSITAMLNRHGEATVYFGVKDNGEVCGLEIGKETLMDIRNRIRDKIEPRIFVEIKDESDESGNKYIKVMAKGSDAPYSFDGRYYIRNVSADEQASNEMLRKMLSNSDADIARQKASPVQDLTFRALFTILAGCGIHSNDTEEFYNNYGMLNHDGKFNLNAYLLSDNNDISIKVVVFEGANKSFMSKRTEYGGKSLLLSVSEVMEYFESINTTNTNLSQSRRKEEFLFDYPSFREAWINACVHNAWSDGIAPSVFMFDDRIEIVSYGGLPFSLSKEGFYAGTSIPVNKSLLMVFLATKFAEQSGHGIPTIVERYGRDVFSFDDGILKVTIPLAFERMEVSERKGQLLQKRGLTKNQRKVYEYLSVHPKDSLQDVADNIGLSLAGVKKICSKLQDYNLLERNGSKRDGYWVTK